MTDRLTAARDRVRDFLDRRAALGGPIDHEVIATVGASADQAALRRSDLEHLLAVSAAPSAIGTRSPSVRLPHDTALRELRDVLTTARAAGVGYGSVFHAVLVAFRDQVLGGPRERLEADVFAAIAELPVSPLDAMVGKRGQAYAERSNEAVVKVERIGAGPYRIDVAAVPE